MKEVGYRDAFLSVKKYVKAKKSAELCSKGGESGTVASIPADPLDLEVTRGLKVVQSLARPASRSFYLSMYLFISFYLSYIFLLYFRSICLSKYYICRIYICIIFVTFYH